VRKADDILSPADYKAYVNCAWDTPMKDISYNVEVKAKGDTYDDGKEPLANLPWDALLEVSRVQMAGHKKYKDFNNYRRGIEITRNLSCALRHIVKYLRGENIDPETGTNHLANAAIRCLFVLQNLAEGTAIDDRFKLDASR
jgi:hypothetical protein